MDVVLEPLQFEQLEVGHRWVSPSRTVTETDIVQYSQISGDDNPLHVNEEFAKQIHRFGLFSDFDPRRTPRAALAASQ